MARTTSNLRVVDSTGNVQGADIHAGYKNSDSDENPTGSSYYGFIDTDGNWYIMKRVVTGAIATVTYSAGATNYSTNWTDRASLSYATFDVTF